MIKFEGGGALREVDVLMNYNLITEDGLRSTYMEGKQRKGGIMYKFKGVGLRKVNVLINYDLMTNIVPLGRGRRGSVILKSLRVEA